MKIKIKKTNRGFAVGEFKDRYGAKCSIQKSSLATEDAIWLGAEVTPQIMASDAVKLGRSDLLAPGQEVSGWVPWPVPPQVALSSRMHLTRKMVAKLLPLLQRFVETGDLA